MVSLVVVLTSLFINKANGIVKNDRKKLANKWVRICKDD